MDGEFNIDDLFSSLISIDDVKKVINLNANDEEEKHIGDRVNIIDYSSVSHFNGKILSEYDINEICDANYLIVISTNERVQFNFMKVKYIQDLVIVNPNTNKQYRVTSNHVRIYKQS